jgi:hypothetical protein
MGHTATVAQRGRGLGVTLQRGPQDEYGRRDRRNCYRPAAREA